MDERATDHAHNAHFFPVVTTALVALCTLLFLTLWISGLVGSPQPGDFAITSLWAIPNDDQILQRAGALELTRVWIDREWWRVLTAPFLHGSWIHLVLNMIALWSVGGWIELAWGRSYTATMFLLASIGGCLASLLWAEAAVIVGASGGILGLAGALWLARRSGDDELKELLEPVSARQLGWMIGLVIVLGAVIPVIAQAGHLGGLAVGLAMAAPMLRTRRALSIVAGSILVVAAVPLANAPVWRTNYYTFTGFRHLREDNRAQALEFLEAALARSPEDPSLANAVAYELSLQGVLLDRAMTLVDFALEQEPENPDFLDTRGWILCRQGDAEEGKRWLQRAVKADEDPSEEILEHVDTCDSAKVLD